MIFMFMILPLMNSWQKESLSEVELIMTKKEILMELLQPYLDADIKTEIPNEAEMGVKGVMLDAEYYDLFDEYIEILKRNPVSEDDPKKSYFEMLELTGAYLPPLEIVDDDVEVYEDGE